MYTKRNVDEGEHAQIKSFSESTRVAAKHQGSRAETNVTNGVEEAERPINYHHNFVEIFHLKIDGKSLPLVKMIEISYVLI